MEMVRRYAHLAAEHLVDYAENIAREAPAGQGTKLAQRGDAGRVETTLSAGFYGGYG